MAAISADQPQPSAAPTSSIGVKTPPGMPQATEPLVAMTFATISTRSVDRRQRCVEEPVERLVAVAGDGGQPDCDDADDGSTGHGAPGLRHRMAVEPGLEARQHALEHHGRHRGHRAERGKGDQLGVGAHAQTRAARRWARPPTMVRVTREAPTVAAITGISSVGAATPAIVSSTNRLAAKGVLYAAREARRGAGGDEHPRLGERAYAADGRARRRARRPSR